MKNLVLLSLGIVAGIVVLSNLGSIVGLGVSLFIAYLGLYFYRKNESSGSKTFWGIVIVISLLTAISNIPAFIGIIALIGALYIWNEWKKGKSDDKIIEHKPSSDPFVNFEKQWDEMNKNNQ